MMKVFKELAEKVLAGDEKAVLLVQGLEPLAKMNIQLEINELKEQRGLMTEAKPSYDDETVAESLKNMNEEYREMERRKSQLFFDRQEAEREQKLKAARALIGY